MIFVSAQKNVSVFTSVTLMLVSMFFSHAAFAFDVPNKYRGGLTVVHSSSMPPMGFLGVNGEPKGLIIDFWRKWSAETGVPVTFKLVNWSEGLDLVKSGQADVHGGLFLTEDRLAYLNYSDKLFPIETALFSMKGRGVENLDDLKGKVVGVITKGSTAELLRREYPAIKTREYPNLADVVPAFESGEVAAIGTDYPTLMYLAASHGILKEIVLIKVIEEQFLRAGVAKGNEVLLDLVVRGIQEVDEKERELILHRWFVRDGESSSTLRIVAIGSLVALIGAVFILIFGGRARRSE